MQSRSPALGGASGSNELSLELDVAAADALGLLLVLASARLIAAHADIGECAAENGKNESDDNGSHHGHTLLPSCPGGKAPPVQPAGNHPPALGLEMLARSRGGRSVLLAPVLRLREEQNEPRAQQEQGRGHQC